METSGSWWYCQEPRGTGPRVVRLLHCKHTQACTHTLPNTQTHSFLTHMCTYTCTHMQSLSDTHALKHSDTQLTHTRTHTFLVITSETASIASVLFTTSLVLSGFQSSVPKLVVFTLTVVCQNCRGVFKMEIPGLCTFRNSDSACLEQSQRICM